MNAKEFFTQRNGGKDPDTSTNHGDLITPIHAVELMEEYAQSKLTPLTPEQVREEAEEIALHWVEYLDNGKSDFLHKAAIKEMTDDICKFIEGANFASTPRFKEQEIGKRLCAVADLKNKS